MHKVNPDPVHFRSGGCCYVRTDHSHAGAPHYHAEAADNDGTLDTTLPHVFTAQDQNALVWLVFRNAHKFEVIKPREPMIICVPDFDPEVFKESEPREQNLGTESNSMMCKVYQLVLPDEKDLPLIVFCNRINQQPDFSSTMNFILACTDGKKTHRLASIVPIISGFYKKPGVRKVHAYFLNFRHVQLLKQLFDELISLTTKLQKGVANHTSCTVVQHDHFPEMIRGTVPAEIKDVAFPLLDELSQTLPEQSVFIHAKEKPSPGGWKIFCSDQEGTYVAVLYAQATNHFIGANIVDALVLAFNTLGFKAKKSFHPVIQKTTLQVAFDLQQLRSLNMPRLKETTANYLHQKKMTH